MSINVNDKNLGHATAYAYYKAGGGTMTEAEFTEFMADFGTASQTAVEAAQAALASETAARNASTTATNKASEATTAAQTATSKAAEASTSASTATSAKDTAVSASQTATTKAGEATTAAATATSAKTDAVAANTAAQSAKTAAQTAQTGAETAAASVEASAAQITQNTTAIEALKSELTALTSYKDAFNGYVSKGVNASTISDMPLAKSVLWDVVPDKYYIITSTAPNGGMNRFILYGSTDGIHATELFRYTSERVPNPAKYTYHNTEYKALLLVVFYGNTEKPTIDTEIIESDSETIPDAFTVNGIDVATAEEMNDGIYRAKFSTIAPKETIDTPYNGNFYLIAIKTDNTYYGDAPNGRTPVAKGYLYLNIAEQKLYYSDGKYDNPKYLCDWNSLIADGIACQYYHCTITKDGDIIFLHRPYNSRVRKNPIIYEHGNYNNPHIIDFGEDVKPFGFAVDSGVDHCYNGDYFMFAEYRGWSEEDNDTELYIWKVVKPYNTKSCWTRALTQYVRHYTSPEGSHTGNEIGHFHTCNYDFYSGEWVASSGDMNYQIKFFTSKDNGATWQTETTIAGQASRTVGVVFTKDGLYYQTDSTGYNHELYRIGRDSNGYIDFSTQEKICSLSNTGAAGYGTALMSEPYGLVLIDRMEAGAQGVDTLPLYFYDLNKQKLIHLMDAKAIDGYTTYDYEGRFGLPPFAYTHYQSPYESGIIMGATTVTKPFLLELVGNKKDIIVGVLKEEIV